MSPQPPRTPAKNRGSARLRALGRKKDGAPATPANRKRTAIIKAAKSKAKPTTPARQPTPVPPAVPSPEPGAAPSPAPSSSPLSSLPPTPSSGSRPKDQEPWRVSAAASAALAAAAAAAAGPNDDDEAAAAGIQTANGDTVSNPRSISSGPDSSSPSPSPSPEPTPRSRRPASKHPSKSAARAPQPPPKPKLKSKQQPTMSKDERTRRVKENRRKRAAAAERRDERAILRKEQARDATTGVKHFNYDLPPPQKQARLNRTRPFANPHPNKKYKNGQRLLAEIRYLQQNTGLLIAKNPFMRLVREIALELNQDLRFQASAIDGLQESAEAFATALFTDAWCATIHAKRVTVQQKDLAFILGIWNRTGVFRTELNKHTGAKSGGPSSAEKKRAAARLAARNAKKAAREAARANAAEESEDDGTDE